MCVNVVGCWLRRSAGRSLGLGEMVPPFGGLGFWGQSDKLMIGCDVC